MRVSSNQILEAGIQSMDNSLADAIAWQKKISTGKNYSKASDNPYAVSRGVRLDFDVARLEMYKTNQNYVASTHAIAQTQIGTIIDELIVLKQAFVQSQDGALNNNNFAMAGRLTQNVQAFNTAIARTKEELLKLPQTLEASINDIFNEMQKRVGLLEATKAAGQGLAAYERFGNIIKVINTYQPVSAVNSNTYVISAYNDNWGWGLVLPNTGYGTKIKDYYTFYNHISTIEGSIKDSIINFEDTNTTISPTTSSYSDWSQQDGIISNLISNQLYKGLDLFD